MRRNALLLITGCAFAASTTFLCAIKADDKTAENRQDVKARTLIVIDDEYMKPVVRFTPPKDANGKSPHDALKDFWRFVDDGNYVDARKLCALKPDESWPSVGTEKFPEFCKNLGQSVKSIRLSKTAVYGKRYWSVFYQLTTKDDQAIETRIYLKNTESGWRIIEKPSWGEIALGTAKSFYW